MYYSNWVDNEVTFWVNVQSREKKNHIQSYQLVINHALHANLPSHKYGMPWLKMNILEGARADPTCSQTSVRDITDDIREEKMIQKSLNIQNFCLNNWTIFWLMILEASVHGYLYPTTWQNTIAVEVWQNRAGHIMLERSRRHGRKWLKIMHLQGLS